MNPLILAAIRYGIPLAVCGGLLLAYNHHQRNIGARKAIAKVEKNNAAVVQKSATAGVKSRDPGTRGLRDPYSASGN